MRTASLRLCLAVVALLAASASARELKQYFNASTIPYTGEAIPAIIANGQIVQGRINPAGVPIVSGSGGCATLPPPAQCVSVHDNVRTVLEPLIPQCKQCYTVGCTVTVNAGENYPCAYCAAQNCTAYCAGGNCQSYCQGENCKAINCGANGTYSNCEGVNCFTSCADASCKAAQCSGPGCTTSCSSSQCCNKPNQGYGTMCSGPSAAPVCGVISPPTYTAPPTYAPRPPTYAPTAPPTYAPVRTPVPTPPPTAAPTTRPPTAAPTTAPPTYAPTRPPTLPPTTAPPTPTPAPTCPPTPSVSCPFNLLPYFNTQKCLSCNGANCTVVVGPAEAATYNCAYCTGNGCKAVCAAGCCNSHCEGYDCMAVSQGASQGSFSLCDGPGCMASCQTASCKAAQCSSTGCTTSCSAAGCLQQANQGMASVCTQNGSGN